MNPLILQNKNYYIWKKKKKCEIDGARSQW